MRLFTGISISTRLSETLSRVVGELHSTADLNWSPPENWHVTTKFIGEWPEERLQELKSALTAMTKPARFDIALARFGFFPNPHHPHTLFAGVRAGPELKRLAGTLDDVLASLGREPETREYSPHLTLARIKNQDIRELREQIARNGTTEFGTFPAVDFHLYLSRAAGGRSSYSILETYPLEGKAPDAQ